MSYGIQEAMEQMQALLDAGQTDQAVGLGQSAADSYNENPSPGGADPGTDEYRAENPQVDQFLQQADQQNPNVQWNTGYAPGQAAPFIPSLPGYTTPTMPVNPLGNVPPAAAAAPAAQVAQRPAGTPQTTQQVAPAQPGITPMQQGGQPVAGNPPLAGESPERVKQILKEFLESDPYLILNHSQNALRRRGASQMFQRWFNQNFNRFLGEYQGLVAEQALNGQVPTVSFVDYVLSLNLEQERAASAAPDQPGVQNYRFSNYLRTAGAASR